MVEFEKFELENGLRVIVHKDKTTPIVAFNILYDVGARDEDPERTGFAHLFEHLMFGGSVNIPKYDEPLERVGGENNAFTNNDITNYYLTLPKDNLETAFWLESDRMLGLGFSKKSLNVQRNVVIEEFKQSYLNQPYGGVWLILRPMAYKVHPYQWATIGKDISHIKTAAMEDVKAFFQKHYCPNNAILTVAGDVETDQIKVLAEKWFGPIKRGEKNARNIPQEPEQNEHRTLKVERDVQANAIYKVYKMCGRLDQEYYSTDMISDVLSGGDSSRLYKELVKNQQLFSKISAYQMGHFDKGLFVISGYLSEGVNFEKAEKAINQILATLQAELIEENELQKVKNKVEAQLVFSEMNCLNKAMNLSYFELLGDAALLNKEMDFYNSVSREDIKNVAKTLFDENKCSTLYYSSKS